MGADDPGGNAGADLYLLPAGSGGAPARERQLVLRAGSTQLWRGFGLAADDVGRGAARTTVKIDAKNSAHNVVVHVQAGVDGVIFNGHWLSGFTNIYQCVDLNVTPWVHFGQDNELIVVFHDKITIQEASLGFYDKGVYP